MANSQLERPKIEPQMHRVDGSVWVWLALVVAVMGVAGSLFLSLGMNLRACPLCFYQRAFMMGLVGVLALGTLTGAAAAGRLSLLALPLAVAGLGVAVFHVSLEVNGKLECPTGILGLGTAPQQSLAMFVLVTLLLAADVLRAGSAAAGMWAAAAALLGVCLAVGSSISNPPIPGAPAQPYTAAPEVCRPPYRPQG
jgi:disulfide bond formation protein DsbB